MATKYLHIFNLNKIDYLLPELFSRRDKCLINLKIPKNTNIRMTNINKIAILAALVTSSPPFMQVKQPSEIRFKRSISS